MLIGGKSVDALSGRTFESQNPYTDRPWALVPDGGPEDVDVAVGAARAALDGEWGTATGFDRSRLMHGLADLIHGQPLLLPQGTLPPESWSETWHDVPTLTEEEFLSGKNYP